MNRVHVTQQKEDDNVNITRAVPLRLIVERRILQRNIHLERDSRDGERCMVGYMYLTCSD